MLHILAPYNQAMRKGAKISVIIPALNEEEAIGHVLDALPEWVDAAVVVDNGSTDRTSVVAGEHGALVVREPQRGYGAACLAGIAALESPEVIVFLDGDFSDDPSEMELLVDPILDKAQDMVVGSRIRGYREPDALTPQARFGNLLACSLLRLFWGARYTDLGPFRAIHSRAFGLLNMEDQNFGWTVEMQVKAAKLRLRTQEVPVNYRRRIGTSKISGTLKGSVLAGHKILYTIARELFGGMPRNIDLPRERIILFTRYPEPGFAKTRLMPTLGEEGAARLQRKMTEHILRVVKDTSAEDARDYEIRFEGGSKRDMGVWLGLGGPYAPQAPGGLGQRMCQAFDSAFAQGFERAVLIGSDVPGISKRVLTQAFFKLKGSDVVLGPAKDGGYYLIGLKQHEPELFEGVEWGTDRVLEQTLASAEERRLSVAQLPTLADVDGPEDLPVWEEASGP